MPIINEEYVRLKRKELRELLKQREALSNKIFGLLSLEGEGLSNLFLHLGTNPSKKDMDKNLASVQERLSELNVLSVELSNKQKEVIAVYEFLESPSGIIHRPKKT